MAFGEMADETILSSTRAQPAKLLSTGFKFRLPELEGALTELIKNGGRIESPPRDSASVS
jgi:NAD dependent epimerase/dehydratase family enzyme